MTSQESSDLSIPAQQVITVSELTSHIKAVVEGTFPSLWVAGEISDLARPRSGHLYFTLKDDDAQIRGILWRTTASRLGFEVEDGQAVICFGDLEVYPARGTYQLVVRKIEPQGLVLCSWRFSNCRPSCTLKDCSRLSVSGGCQNILAASGS